MEVEKDLTEEQRSILPKIEKLLRLAARNDNAEEAASAAARANELLLAYNLSADMVGEDSEGGQRAEVKLGTGQYKYQEELWGWVAEINFCLHFMRGSYVETGGKDRWGDPKTVWRKSHVVIGKRVNVAATKAMATYLEQAVERLVMERLGGNNNQRFSQWAVSFRKGAVSDITDRLYKRRQELLSEERKREQEAMRAAEEAGLKGASTSTAISLASLAQSERDANIDLLMEEPGYSARKRAEQAARAAARAAADAEYARWAAAHPEEARAEEAKRRAEEEKVDKRRRGGGRGGSSKSDIGDWSAYAAGRSAGANIGLDPQTSGTRTAGALK